MQLIASLGHVDNVFAMQGVLGFCAADIASGFINEHAALLSAQALLVVREGKLIISTFTKFTLEHAPQLSAIFPNICPGAITQQVANGKELATRNIGWPDEVSDIVLPQLFHVKIVAFSGIGIN